MEPAGQTRMIGTVPNSSATVSAVFGPKRPSTFKPRFFCQACTVGSAVFQPLEASRSSSVLTIRAVSAETLVAPGGGVWAASGCAGTGRVGLGSGGRGAGSAWGSAGGAAPAGGWACGTNGGTGTTGALWGMIGGSGTWIGGRLGPGGALDGDGRTIGPGCDGDARGGSASGGSDCDSAQRRSARSSAFVSKPSSGLKPL